MAGVTCDSLHLSPHTPAVGSKSVFNYFGDWPSEWQAFFIFSCCICVIVWAAALVLAVFDSSALKRHQVALRWLLLAAAGLHSPWCLCSTWHACAHAWRWHACTNASRMRLCHTDTVPARSFAADDRLLDCRCRDQGGRPGHRARQGALIGSGGAGLCVTALTAAQRRSHLHSNARCRQPLPPPLPP